MCNNRNKNDAAAAAADEKHKSENEKMPPLSIWDFFDLNKPWVLVPGGSLKGYFDGVPEKFRVGPWSPLAPVYLTILCASLLYTKPSSPFQFNETELYAYPDLYTPFWFYNVAAFFWMTFILYRCLSGMAGVSVMCTYTIQSWTMITARHGLSVLAPLLPPGHALLQMHEMLRFPSLCTATITFFIWNFAIFPFIYFVMCKTSKKKRGFLKFAFSFNLNQIHLFNIVFAVLNSVVDSPRLFTFQDFWCAFAGATLYALAYLLVLDRIGVHLYPIFSPRTSWSVLTWTVLFFCYWGTFKLWNHVIADGRLSNLASACLMRENPA